MLELSVKPMLPYLEVSGTHQKIGEAIGEHLRDDISIALKQFEKHVVSTPELVARQKKLLQSVRRYFPEYLEEIVGIAAGSGQPLQRIIQFNFEEEVAYFESCSTLAVRGRQGILFGHNEDWEHAMPMYVVKAKPKKGPTFLSLSYAGQLPGISVAMNSAGLVYSANSIATNINANGLPKAFCLRALASARSLNQIVNMLDQKDRTIGNSSVIVYKDVLYLLEWSPYAIGIEMCEPWIAHANRFVLRELQNEQLPAPRGSTSDARMKHIWQWLVDTPHVGVRGMKEILSSHGDDSALCKHQKSNLTVASVVMDIHKQEMQVAYGNPCEKPYQRFWL